MTFIDNPLYISETHKAKNCEARCFFFLRSPSWVVTIQHRCLWESLYWQLRVSINGGTTKSSIYRWIFHYKPSIWGISFMKTPSWHPWEDFACPCCIVYMVFFLVCRTPSFSCLFCHVCWECILTLCCLSKNMLLGFLRYVFTCCIDKYQYMLLGNLIIDYLAWFVGALHVFLMLQYQQSYLVYTPWVFSYIHHLIWYND